MRLIAIATILPFVLVSPCAAQGEATATIDEFVRAEMRQQRIPGLALAVIRDGRVVVAKGYGLANVEHDVPVRPETVFQSGSMAKQFTAAAVMMLAEEGRLSLDDKEPNVTALTKRALSQLADGTADRDLFTAEARAAMFPDRAKQIGERLRSLSLPVAIISFSELVERREENGLRIYRYALTDLGAELFCTMAFTREDKIARILVSTE